MKCIERNAETVARRVGQSRLRCLGWTVLLVLLLQGACGYAMPWAELRVVANAVDEQELVVVVLREEGTKSEVHSIEHMSDFHRKRNRLFLVHYPFGSTASGHEVPCTVEEVFPDEILPMQWDYYHSGKLLAKLTSSGIGGKAWSLIMKGNPHVENVRVKDVQEEDVHWLAQRAFPLGGCGDNLYRDRSGNLHETTYLALQDYGNHIWVAQPADDVMTHWGSTEKERIECIDSFSVWDPSRHSLVFFLRNLNRGFIPFQMLIWDYRSGSTAKFRLQVPGVSEFR